MLPASQKVASRARSESRARAGEAGGGGLGETGARAGEAGRSALAKTSVSAKAPVFGMTGRWLAWIISWSAQGGIAFKPVDPPSNRRRQAYDACLPEGIA